MTIPRQPINTADYERIADRRIQERLQLDPRYRNAESAEDQARAEATITAEVEATMRRDYVVVGEQS